MNEIPSIFVSAEKGAFSSNTTESSKELVKKLYYALKRKGLFYRFQRTYYPLSGLSFIIEGSKRTRSFRQGEGISLGDVIYIPRPTHYDTNDVPKLVYDITCIKSMLNRRYADNPKNDYDYYSYPYSRIPYVYETDVLGAYTDFYFKDYKETKKVKPTNIIFRYGFGVLGLCLFTSAFFYFLSLISVMFALNFCITIGIIALLTTICLLMGD